MYKSSTFAMLLVFVQSLSGNSLPAVAVTNLVPYNVSSQEAFIVTERLIHELSESGKVKLIERRFIDKVIEEQKIQLSGCTTDECLIKIGELANAHKIIAGVISQFGSTYSLQVRLIDVETGIVDESATYDTKNGIENLILMGTKIITNRLLGIGQEGLSLEVTKSNPQSSVRDVAQAQNTPNRLHADEIEWVRVPDGSKYKSKTWQNVPYNYEIMKYEVTNAQFVMFLNYMLSIDKVNVKGRMVKGYYRGDEKSLAGNYPFYDLYGTKQISFKNGVFEVVDPFSNHPAGGVSWWSAQEFASLYGFTLPSRDEWKAAAMGSRMGWDYVDGGRSYSNTNYTSHPLKDVSMTTPVGYFKESNSTDSYKMSDGSSDFDVYDMYGNIAEYVNEVPDHANYVILLGGYYGSDGPSWRGIGHNENMRWIPEYAGFRCIKK